MQYKVVLENIDAECSAPVIHLINILGPMGAGHPSLEIMNVVKRMPGFHLDGGYVLNDHTVSVGAILDECVPIYTMHELIEQCEKLQEVFAQALRGLVGNYSLEVVVEGLY